MDTPRDTIGTEQLLAQLGWVKALALRLVVDPNVADDVLQRVCLLALEKTPRDVSGEAGLRRWLSTVTRRLASHSRRSEARRRHREEGAARREGLPATVDVAARREALHSLVDAVTGLSQPDLTTITQRYFEGLSVAEMATRLDVSRDVVRQRLSRARRRLRARLARDVGPDRDRWLAALGPLALPAAWSRDATEATICKQLGGLVMAKITPFVAVKVTLAAGLVTAVAVTAWQALDDPAPDPTAAVVPRQRRAQALPVASDLPLATEPTEAVPQEVPVVSPQEVAAEGSGVVELPLAAAVPSGLLAALDRATESFLTDSPDLQSLNEVIRHLARTAELLPDTVATSPLDGSIHGWLAIPDTELKGEFNVDAEGRCGVKFHSVLDERLEDLFLARDLSFSFQGDSGRAADVSTHVQYHPDTSESAIAAQFDSVGEVEGRVGWSLSIGPGGTALDPVTVVASAADTLVIGRLGNASGFHQAWATDTSAYDAWLLLLQSHAP